MKFLTFSNHRSGSSCFQRYIDQHPNIMAGQENLRKAHEVTNEFLWNYLSNFFRNNFGDKKAVGFKVQYSHVTPDLLEYIKHNDIKIIQLIRRDLLNMMFWFQGCYEIVEGKITRPGFGPPLLLEKGTKVKANIDNLIGEMEWVREQIDIYRDMADLTIYYEDMTGGENSKVFNNKIVEKKIFEFLGVPFMNLILPQEKADRPPLEEICINYDEMLEVFRDKNIKIWYADNIK